MTQNTQQWSVSRSMTADQATSDDKLGFEPYGRAIRDFLISEDTEAPLTLSVEGEWGSGKSSFMKQLQGMLKDTDPQSITVWFNPWRHDDEKALWAAFVLQFLDEVQRSVRWWQRPFRNWWLYFWQFDWSQGWMHLVRKVVLTLLAVGLIVGAPIYAGLEGLGNLRALFDQKDQETLATLATALGGGAVYVTMFLTFAMQVRKLFESPAEVDLRRFVKSPNYEDRISFVEQFHRDFGKIVRTYVGKRKAYVFIDDLDRCEIPKAAELMKAINLMISNEGDLPIVFIIGMDREKVAAGLAVQHQDLIPYIRGQEADLRIGAIEHGYEFIEKFIQLSFAVPRPSKGEFQQYVAGLARDRAEHSAEWSFLGSIRIVVAGAGRALGGFGRAAARAWGRIQSLRANTRFRPRSARVELDIPESVLEQLDEIAGDQPRPTSEAIASMLEEGSPTLENIVEVLGPTIEELTTQTQFFESLRKCAARAQEEGLFVNGRLTLEQLAKLQALNLDSLVTRPV